MARNKKKRLSVTNGHTSSGFTYKLRADKSYSISGVSEDGKLCTVVDDDTGKRQIAPYCVALAYCWQD